MTASEERYLEAVAALGCVVCRRASGVYTPAEIHHVAEGSSVRSNFAVAPLCAEHHRGASSFHAMGSKFFCSVYSVPWRKEEGLLAWVAEDLARFGAIIAPTVR